MSDDYQERMAALAQQWLDWEVELEVLRCDPRVPPRRRQDFAVWEPNEDGKFFWHHYSEWVRCRDIYCRQRRLNAGWNIVRVPHSAKHYEVCLDCGREWLFRLPADEDPDYLSTSLGHRLHSPTEGFSQHEQG